MHAIPGCPVGPSCRMCASFIALYTFGNTIAKLHVLSEFYSKDIVHYFQCSPFVAVQAWWQALAASLAYHCTQVALAEAQDVGASSYSER